jgi:hypothetical protein
LRSQKQIAGGHSVCHSPPQGENGAAAAPQRGSFFSARQRAIQKVRFLRDKDTVNAAKTILESRARKIGALGKDPLCGARKNGAVLLRFGIEGYGAGLPFPHLAAGPDAGMKILYRLSPVRAGDCGGGYRLILIDRLCSGGTVENSRASTG